MEQSLIMQRRMLRAVNLVKNNVVKKLNQGGQGEPYEDILTVKEAEEPHQDRLIHPTLWANGK